MHDVPFPAEALPSWFRYPPEYLLTFGTCKYRTFLISS